MNRVSKCTFVGEDIILDNHQFENCIFNSCRLIYNGIGPTSLISNVFENCHWVLDGPALNTVYFLKAIYHQLPTELSWVDDVIKFIKDSENRPTLNN